MLLTSNILPPTHASIRLQCLGSRSRSSCTPRPPHTSSSPPRTPCSAASAPCFLGLIVPQHHRNGLTQGARCTSSGRNTAAPSHSDLGNCSLGFFAVWEVWFSTSLLEGCASCTSAVFSVLWFMVTVTRLFLMFILPTKSWFFHSVKLLHGYTKKNVLD